MCYEENKLIILGSSSAGNGYVIRHGMPIRHVVIEAGVPYKEVLKACKYNSSSIDAVVVSHAHGDHAKYVKEYAKNGLRIYCNADVAKKYELDGENITVIDENAAKSFFQTVNVFGNTAVYTFPLRHDVPNNGYFLQTSAGTIFFGTDTYAYPRALVGCDYYMVEANYADHILNESSTDQFQKNRIITSHMSLDYTIAFLKRCHAEKAKAIILIHLSDRHSNEEEFKMKVQQEFGVPVYIADKNMEIPL